MRTPPVPRESFEAASFVVQTNLRTFEFEVTAAELRQAVFGLELDSVAASSTPGEIFEAPKFDLDMVVKFEGVRVRGTVTPRTAVPLEELHPYTSRP